ncbi:MAG: hypothetical protein QGG33_00210 [Candidatus Krumholzibacteria bacterium]|jgi:hypothetical protein|nr:hypothetical protein [Candidatus Krumholzibacteria bacterium]
MLLAEHSHAEFPILPKASLLSFALFATGAGREKEPPATLSQLTGFEHLSQKLSELASLVNRDMEGCRNPTGQEPGRMRVQKILNGLAPLKCGVQIYFFL